MFITLYKIYIAVQQIMYIKMMATNMYWVTMFRMLTQKDILFVAFLIGWMVLFVQHPTHHVVQNASMTVEGKLNISVEADADIKRLSIIQLWRKYTKIEF